MATTQESQASFRCPVQPDCATAVIRSGRRRIPAALLDCSLEGYTLVIEPENALRLQVGKQWILEAQGSQTLVVAKWLYRDDDGRLQLALRRIKDLGKPEDQYPSAWFAWTRRRQPHIHPGGNELAFAGIAFLLFLLLALPGFGDRLGTSRPIQTAVRSVFSFFW